MKTVLVVDDSSFMRLVLKNSLTKHGYEVVGEASDGQTAIKMYNDLHPDIVTMDITMSDMNGVDALHQIIGHNPAAKVVMVSSMGQEAFVRDAIMAGAKGFLVKPFDEKLLVSTLRKLHP